MDLDESRRFLTALDDSAEFLTFQTATDAAPKPAPDPLAKWFNLPPDNLTKLDALNAKGAAIWVMVNEGTGKSRRAESVKRVRAVFADLDGKPWQPAMECGLEPHMVVETSPGHFHVYWLVEGLRVDQFEGVQRRIAERFGGDPVVDLPRVMRVPGFVHQKGAPFVSRIVHQDEGLPHQAARVLEAFPPIIKNGAAGEGHFTANPNARRDRRFELMADDQGCNEDFAKSWNCKRGWFKADGSTPDWNVYDMSLAVFAAMTDWATDQDIADLIVDFRTIRGADLSKVLDRKDYMDETIRKARAFVAAKKPEKEAVEEMVDRDTPFRDLSANIGAMVKNIIRYGRDPAVYYLDIVGTGELRIGGAHDFLAYNKVKAVLMDHHNIIINGMKQSKWESLLSDSIRKFETRPPIIDDLAEVREMIEGYLADSTASDESDEDHAISLARGSVIRRNGKIGIHAQSVIEKVNMRPGAVRTDMKSRQLAFVLKALGWTRATVNVASTTRSYWFEP